MGLYYEDMKRPPRKGIADIWTFAAGRDCRGLSFWVVDFGVWGKLSAGLRLRDASNAESSTAFAPCTRICMPVPSASTIITSRTGVAVRLDSRIAPTSLITPHSGNAWCPGLGFGA